MKLKLARLLSGALTAFAVLTFFPTHAQATYPKVCYGASISTVNANGGADNRRIIIFNRHENVTKGVHTASCGPVIPTKYDGLYLWNVSDASWTVATVLTASSSGPEGTNWRIWCANAGGDIRMMHAGGGGGNSGLAQLGGWYGALLSKYIGGRVVTHEMGHTEYANHSDGYCSAQHSDYMQAGGFYCNGGRDLRPYFAGPNFYAAYGLPNDPSHNAAGVILSHRFQVESRKP